MTLYQKFKMLNIDFAAIELDPAVETERYFCTPVGARILAAAGVDGIHYCTIRGQGETVFAVNPMNLPGENVYPIAADFEQLLQMLLAAGSMAAIEQAHRWDEEQFSQFVAENPPTAAQQEAFAVLRDKLGITPLPQPFSALYRLQERFDYGQLHFSKAYYEALPAQDTPPAEWRVTLEGGFRPGRGKGGREIPVNRQFAWGDELWHLPAVHLCSGGAVVDFCIRLREDRVRERFYRERERAESLLSWEQRLTRRREDPMQIGFGAELCWDGEALRARGGCYGTWIPWQLAGDESWMGEDEKWILQHYGLDLTRPWVISRQRFLWEGGRREAPRSLRLRLEREHSSFFVARFDTPAVHDGVTFTHPVTGREHRLTVCEIKQNSLDAAAFAAEDLEFPTHCTVLTFRLEPDLPGESFSLSDSSGGDRPRPKHPDPHGRRAMWVGGMAVPRMRVSATDDRGAPLHAAASSLSFEPPQQPVNWQLVVREKLLPDLEVALLG
ncbi:MAG: hypothetical protein IJC43_04475 [Clostridia bacterium]|nr:hypothetical protein [Clostridia bacterium]